MPIKPDHPRLLITPERLAALADPAAKPLTDRLRVLADGMLGQPPAERVLDGRRLLTVSRLVLDRCSVLGLAHQLWGGPYAERVRVELAAVSAFSDWHPVHFLDTAEMAAAVALGLDWCWDALPEADRTQAIDALDRLAFAPALAEKHWWKSRDNNWNQVCFGGLVMAALAIHPSHGSSAQRIIAEARTGIAAGLHAYAPEGVYPEGPTYWEYGTTYSVLMADALHTAAGEDWGLAAAPGFLASVRFAQVCTAPSGLPFCYGDAWHGRMPLAPAVWMAARLGDDAVVGWARAHLAGSISRTRFLPFAMLWASDGQSAPAATPTVWCGHGPVEVASLRSAWRPRALWAGLKAGALRVNHGHLDAGSIELELDGVRWFTDLGAEPDIYARTDGWGTDQESHRWDYLRTSNAGHNLVMVGGRRQCVDGHNPIRVSGSAAVADLSTAYADCTRSASRGIALLGEAALLIQDEFTGLPAESLFWQVFTGAHIQTAGAEATLVQDGCRLTVRVLEPAGAVFRERSATPPTAAEEQNVGFRRLVLELPAVAGDRRIRVLCSRGPVEAPPPRPLSAW